MPKIMAIDKLTLRRELLEGMCNFAEFGFKYGCVCYLLKHYHGKLPQFFKPGISDRMLFAQLVDLHLDTIAAEISEPRDSLIAGRNLVNSGYFSRFSTPEENETKA